MLYAGISGICSLLTFWLPLLLTAKLLSNLNQTSYVGNGLIGSMQFLLNYWICYIVFTYVEKSEVSKLLADQYAEFGFSLVKIWLFYGHGCLIMNNYYLDSLFKRLFIKSASKSVNTLQVLEANLIDPLVDLFLIRNFVVQNMVRLFHKSRIGLIRGLVAYNYELRKNFNTGSKGERTSFLQFSLDYLCYMDDPNELKQRFQNSQNILTHFLSVISLPPVEDAKGNRSMRRSHDLDYNRRLLEKNRRKTDSRRDQARFASLPASIEYPMDINELRGRDLDRRVYSLHNPTLTRKPPPDDQTMSRKSLVEDKLQFSPRNSLAEDKTQFSPRNSLAEDQIQFLLDQNRHRDQISKSINNEMERRKNVETELQKMTEIVQKHHQQKVSIEQAVHQQQIEQAMQQKASVEQVMQHKASIEQAMQQKVSIEQAVLQQKASIEHAVLQKASKEQNTSPYSKLKPPSTSELPAPGMELHYTSNPESRTTSPKDVTAQQKVGLTKDRSNSSSSPQANLGFLKAPPRRNRAVSVSSVAVEDY